MHGEGDPPFVTSALTGKTAPLDENGLETLLSIPQGTSIEVEDTLFSHPAVAEVAVIGVPDERWGETVKALVVLAPDAEATEADLIAYCKSKLAGYKCPTTVEFRDELARTATGKLQKFKLRAPYWEGRERQVN